METSKFVGLLYLGKLSPLDYIRWANTCIAEGKTGENLERLASMSAGDDVFHDADKLYKLVRNCFGEIGFRCHPSEIDSLIENAKMTARDILVSRIQPADGVSKIARIAERIDFPFMEELSDWIYLDEGNHPDCTEKWWIFERTNQEKWLEVVMREANNLQHFN
jgi:uncharacterized ferritin-like protein (DUF455 family)